MNKRNTFIAIVVLAVLVVLLIGKNVHRHHRGIEWKMQTTEHVDLLLDLNLATGFDSATVQTCNLPIVIHYPKPTNVNGSSTQLHIFSLSVEVLKNLATPGKGGIMPDSTQGIHIYPKYLSSRTSSVNLLLFTKVSMKEQVQYVVTYPVRDSLGVHVIEDSGLVSTEFSRKNFGFIDHKTQQEDTEKSKTKQLEECLIRDVAKKMKDTER